MVARGRPMALWFVTMLLLSVVSITVPPAAATSHISIVKVRAVDNAGIDLIDDSLVPTPSKLKVDVHVRVAPCAGGVSLVLPSAVAITIDGQGYTKTTLDTAQGLDQDGQADAQGVTQWKKRIEVDVDRSANFHGFKALGFNITRTCTPQPVGETAHAGFLQRLEFDTKGPTITVNDPAGNDNKSAVHQVDLPNVNVFGPGSTIRFTPTASDPRTVSSVVVDASAIGLGNALPATSGQPFSLVVPAAGNGVPSIDGPVDLVIKATDAWGNVATQKVTVTVDNDPPPALPAVTTKVTRGPGNTAGVNFAWTAPAGNEGNRVLVAVNGATIMDGTAPKVFTLTGTPAATPTHTLTGVPLTDDLNFALTPVDDAGNLRVGETPQAAAHPRVDGISFGFSAGIPQIVTSNRFGWLNFTIGENAPSTATNNIWITLHRDGFGYLLKNQNGAQDTHFVQNPTGSQDVKHVGAVLGANGAVVFPTFSDDGSPPLNLKAGLYTLGINVNSGAAVNNLLHQVQFRVDGADPDITANGTYGLALSALTKLMHGSDGNPAQVGLEVREQASGDTGLRNVTLELVDATTLEVPRMAGDVFARRDLRPEDCAVIPRCNDMNLPWESRLLFTDGILAGSYNTSFPGVPPGEYYVRVVATDKAGRTKSHLFAADDEVFRVGPRLAMDTTGGLPFADSTRVHVGALAAMDLPASVPRSGLLCSGTTCQVPGVQVVARNLRPDGTLGDEHVLGQVFGGAGLATRPYATTLFDGAAASQTFYNYTLAEGFTRPSALVLTQPIQVQLRATVEFNGTEVSSETPWIIANTATTPSLDATLMNMTGLWRFNTTGKVNYSVSVDLKKLDGTPRLEYKLRRVVPATATTPRLIEERGPFPAVGAFTPEDGTVSWFNGTQLFYSGASGDLPEGEYTVVFEGYDGTTHRGNVTRTFAVSTTPPTIHVEAQDVSSNISLRSAATGQYNVKPQFNVSLRVEHGLLNLTAASAFTYDLSRSFPRDGLPQIIPNGTGGFRVAIRDITPLEPGRSRAFVNLSVTLPDSSRDGDLFDLRINATTDGKAGEDDPVPSRYMAQRVIPLRLDKSPPAVGVNDQQTNGTGDSSELRVIGFAQDVGSGIDRVEVRIYDITRNRTLLWGNPQSPSFGAGLIETDDAFASNDLVPIGLPVTASTQHVRNVAGVTPGATTVEWAIHQWNRPILRADGTPMGGHFRPLSLELDNESVYRVDVRARDRLGQVTEQTAWRTVRFDTQSPVIPDTPTPSGIRFVSAKPNEAGWHGVPDDARFFVNVTDNKCIKRVSLRGFDPTGAALPPVDLRPENATQASCSAYPHSVGMTWTTSLRESAALSDLIGTYRYYVEAEDASGRVSTGSTASTEMFQLKIVDALPPIVRFVNMDPPVIGEDLSSTIRAEVFENHGLDTVEVFVSAIGTGSSVTPLGSAKMVASGTPAANGTGLYVAETGKDIGLSLKKGDYLVQVRANDTAKTCGHPTNPCATLNAILRVSDGAPPAISQVGGRTTFVNGTPRLAYTVVDKFVQSSGVQVRAGNSTENLTIVSPLIEPLLTGVGGARTGVRVTYEPGNLSSDEPLLVEIRAVSNLTNTTTFTYQVDATPPVVNHTVTGLQRIGDKDWVVAATRVSLLATDVGGSGVQRLAYWINDAAKTGAGTAYAGTPLRPTGAKGTWTLDYQATDNASNVASGKVVLNLDGEGPTITVSRHGDSPSILVTDAGVGIDERNVTIHYAYNGTSSFVSKKMERLAGTANAFSADLPGDAATQGLRYWIEAKDLLGNVGNLFNASAPHVIPKDGPVVGNGAPTVRILAPTAGESVRGKVELKWTSLDPENQPLRVSIGLQTPDNPAGVFLVRDGDDNKSWVLDTLGLRAGTYTFTLVATDGNATSEVATRSFVVLAGEVVTRVSLPPPVVEPDTEASFAVDIQPVGKTVKTATYVVTRDGLPYTSGALRVEQGYYVGALTPTEAGDYRVAVVVTYEDGTSDQPVQVASFNVAERAEKGGFPMGLLILLAVGLLTVALAAFGAFGRWK